MIGTEIGSYRVIEKLGEGGMGVVYKGVDTALDRPVAIKVLSSALTSNPELVERFHAEARAQANLNHTNLATLYTFQVHEGSACMVMEFVDGETFEDMILRRGPIPAVEAIPLLKQALMGIGYAHRAGIVHRDIKPANLMVNRAGIVKVMDFGIAKVLGARGMTKTGAQMGTGWYMSPEQVLNKSVDFRSDIYSLGVTLYQMLTAHVPFEGTSDFEIMTGHIQTPPPLPTQFYPYIPKGVENAVLKSLEKQPNNRFQSVEEFGAALEHPDDFVYAGGERRVQEEAQVFQRREVAASPTATMIVMPTGATSPGPPTPAPVPAPAPKPSVPFLASTQSKILAGGGVALAVLLVGWYTLKDTKPTEQTKTVTPANVTQPSTSAPSTPTPLEQQLSAGGTPAVQMSTSSTTPSAPGLKIDSFRADSSSVPSGQKVHLSWSVSGASQVIITPGIGTVKGEGSADVPVSRATEFVLTAKNDAGNSTSRAMTVTIAAGKQETPSSSNVAVRTSADTPSAPSTSARTAVETPPTPPPPQRIPPQIAFQAQPDSIQAGEATMLRWTLTNAQSATIEPGLGGLRQTVGQVRVTPTQTTVYTLNAMSKDGTPATSSVTVQVRPAPAPPPAPRAGFTVVVIHDHGVALGQNNAWNRCWGQLQSIGGHLQYRVIGTSDGRRDDFDIPFANIQEAAANRLPVRQQPAFHLTIGGQHFNFIAQGATPGQVVSAIQREAAQGR
jgi:serine/threonine protein kinase